MGLFSSGDVGKEGSGFPVNIVKYKFIY